MVAELCGHERQAAEELEQWKARREERKPLDASPAAITPALLLTDEELDSLEKGALEMEKQGAEVHGVLEWFAQASATLFSLVAELRGHERQAAEGVDPVNDAPRGASGD